MNKLIEQLLPVSELRVGMYVSSLDRPWLETPFLLQGFTITGQSDIDDLAKYCQYVYVDTVTRSLPADTQLTQITTNRVELQKIVPHRKLRRYSDQTDINEELSIANAAITAFNGTISEVFREIGKSSAIDMPQLRRAVEPMVDSIIRNPDACIWLTRLKNADEYTYQHAVSSSVWAVALGRHIGLPRADLQTLAIGVSLFDIGKMQLPKELLQRRGKLNDEEFETIKSHVQLGIDCLTQAKGVNNSIIDIVAHHHERFDGSGYPNQLCGDQIPLFARIAAIADCYDAMTTKRPYADPISPGRAVKKLFEWRNKSFQSELIEEFIQAIGIYPAGTLVELNNGEVGVVLCEYRSRRLLPKIIQLLDKNKNPLPVVRVVDLQDTINSDTGLPLAIVDSLEPGAYGLELNTLNL